MVISDLDVEVAAPFIERAPGNGEVRAAIDHHGPGRPVLLQAIQDHIPDVLVPLGFQEKLSWCFHIASSYIELIYIIY
jgi:hypothetical protein